MSGLGRPKVIDVLSPPRSGDASSLSRTSRIPVPSGADVLITPAAYIDFANRHDLSKPRAFQRAIYNALTSRDRGWYYTQEEEQYDYWGVPRALSQESPPELRCGHRTARAYPELAAVVSLIFELRHWTPTK